MSVAVDGCVRTSAPYSGIINGEFVSQTELNTLLPDLIKCVNAGKIVIGVPPQFCQVSVTEAEAVFGKSRKITQKDVQSLVKGVHADAVPVYFRADGGQAIIDAVGVVAAKLVTRVNVITFADSFVRAMGEAILGLGVNTEFIAQPLADAMYLTDEEVRDSTCVLVLTGNFSTSLAVVSGDALVWLSSFDIGLAHVINDISLALKIDFPIAQLLAAEVVLSVAMNENDNYQIKINGKEQKFSARKVNQIVKKRMESVAKELKHMIEKADKKLIGHPWFICGGFLDSLRGAREFLSKTIGVRIIQCVDPLTKQNRPDETGLKALVSFTN